MIITTQLRYYYFITFTTLLLFFTASADPDPIQDYCIPIINSSHCKNPANVTVNEFVFSGIRLPGDFNYQTGLAGVSVTPTEFPGLNTLGMSFVRADFQPGGINPPHYHPRATETAIVLEGSLYSGFVDTGGRVFARVIEKGEVMVFPRGLVHFQMNVREARATIFGSFNSQNPGVVRLPAAAFGSAIDEQLLEKAFGLDEKEIRRLRKRFSPNPKE